MEQRRKFHRPVLVTLEILMVFSSSPAAFFTLVRSRGADAYLITRGHLDADIRPVQCDIRYGWIRR
ncbi:hypothetical protein T02_10550 [Trichinella nativa]|uniref:Uncharacterized protein n=1 Tax=Trichinella nativa TaxID=6335 RepID=A0A0V1LFQ7_9BILA|nr:hypothetical protein T02_10550 [Trichinella nativa]